MIDIWSRESRQHVIITTAVVLAGSLAPLTAETLFASEHTLHRTEDRIDNPTPVELVDLPAVTYCTPDHGLCFTPQAATDALARMGRL